MQGNSIKLKGLFCALFLLLTFSEVSFANEQANTVQANTVKEQQTKVQQSASRININKASVEQLSSLPGIGPLKAKAIILVREEKGSFTNLTDLQAVSGIGEKTTARLEPLISF